MSSHASAELLSAYLDQELPEEEVAVLKSHLDQCHECHGRLQSLTTVVSKLRHFESIAPPPTLDLAVVRRIALAGEKKNLLDRLEDGLGAFQRQSSLMMWFCVVFALVMIVFFFLNSLQRSQNSNIPVVFDNNPASVVSATLVDGTVTQDPPTARIFQQQGDEFKEIGEVGSRVELAGRIFERGEENSWFDTRIHSKLTGPAPLTYKRDSESYEQLLTEHPDLEALEALNGTVHVLLGDEVVSLLEPETTKSLPGH